MLNFNYKYLIHYVFLNNKNEILIINNKYSFKDILILVKNNTLNYEKITILNNYIFIIQKKLSDILKKNNTQRLCVIKKNYKKERDGFKSVIHLSKC